MDLICLRPWTRLWKSLKYNNSPSAYLKMASNVSHATHCANSGDLSRRAQRKKNAHQHYVKKHKVEKALKRNEEMNETEYYLENGLRKVYPYYFNFTSYVKGRWIGRTVVDVYMKELNGKSEESLIDEMERGRIRVNGKNVPSDFKLKDGHFIEHVVHRHENPVIGGPLEIIANTPDLVVINKPPSIPCHPCSRYRYNSITFILGVEYGLKNLRTLYRLDRLTSGVLVLPKTTKKSQKWEKQLMNKEFYKEYVCRVEGEFPEGTITCDEPIEVLSQNVSLFKVGPAGKPSSTTFTRLSFNGTSSVVKCVPLTGRSHQIRIHLQYLGYPIMNDPIYNRAIYGKTKGKGGVIETPVSEIIADIKNGTNTGRWKLGENPKYAEFLVKNDVTKCQKDTLIATGKVISDINDSVDVSKSKDETVNSSSAEEKINAGDGVNIDKDRNSVCAESSVTEEVTDIAVDKVNGESHVSEALKDNTVVTSEETAESHDNKMDTSVKTSDGKCDTNLGDISNQVCTGKESTEKNHDAPETDKTPCKRIKLDTDCNESFMVSAESQKVCQETKHIDKIPETHSESIRTGDEVKGVTVKEHEVPNIEYPKPVEAAEFDESKVTYEVNCDECMCLFKDPTPEDLVLYLHAVCYKGPDWEFSTPLPEWAAADWKDK